MSSIYDYLYALYANILSLPLIIQICITFIFGSLILVFSFFFVVALIRYRYNRQLKKENKLFPKIDDLILKYLFSQNQHIEDFEIRNDFVDTLGKLTKEKLNFIVDRLIVCKNNYQIESNATILRLMYVLDLEKHMSDKLQFSSTKTKIRGFKELATLAVSANESDLLPFTYNRNKNVQLEARTTYMKLSKNDPFKFFDETKDDLTLWDQISLLTHLKSLENFSMPNFSKWISYSTNQSVVSFCLKMCAIFNQRESIPSIINFLSTPNHNLRAEAIETLGELNAYESEDVLKNLYPNQPSNCQVAILRSLGKLKTAHSLEFLQTEFNQGSSIEVKKQAADAIRQHGDQGHDLLQSLMNQANDYSKLILQHIENPLILFK